MEPIIEEKEMTKKLRREKAEEKAVVSPGPGTNPGLVCVMPLKKIDLSDITLLDGSSLHVPYWERGHQLKSAPVLRKLLPEYVRKMERKGDIQIVGAGGAN